MRPYSLDYTNGDPEPTGGFVWSGEKIDCLGICPGQTLNKVVYAIATKVCELAAPEDLSNLTLECALDIFNNEEEGDRTLSSVIQLLIDNECGLKELIDSIQSKIDGEGDDALVLDLKCLAVKDSFGNLLPYNTQTVLQSLIDKLCDIADLITGLSGKIDELQEQIDEIVERLPSDKEDLITTCVSANKPVKESVKELAEDYCDYKEQVGSSTDIQKSISQQCPSLSDDLKSVKGWEQNPANLAESHGNLWIAYCNLLDRVKNIETNCCNVSCRDITIGMEVIDAADGKGFYLKFSEAAGTSIPDGFVDKGSYVTLTDSKGAVISYGIDISQNSTTDQMSLIGLDLNNPIDIGVNAVLGSSSLQCEKCLATTYSPTSGCPVCPITVSGKGGGVTILYTMGSSYQTLVIPAGQVGYIPSDAKVITKTSTMGAIASSDCIDLTGEDLVCYGFISAVQNDSGSHTEPLQSNNVFYQGLQVGATKYMFTNETAWDGIGDTLPPAIYGLPGIGQLIMDIKIQGDLDDNYGNRAFIIFKTVPSIGEQLYLISRTALAWGDNINMPMLLPAQTYDDIIAEHGTTNVPYCSPTSDSSNV